MKKILLLFFCSTSVFAQMPNDTVSKKIDALDLFSDYDIALIDSLLMDSKYKSPLYHSSEYLIEDVEEKNTTDVLLTTEFLKQRLAKIDAKTPFHIAYNPALEKVIKSYLKYRKKYYPALMAKAMYYFPMFEKYLDQYDIPLEMKYFRIYFKSNGKVASWCNGLVAVYVFNRDPIQIKGEFVCRRAPRSFKSNRSCVPILV